MIIRADSTLREIAFIVCTELEKTGLTAVLTGGSAVSIWAPNDYQSLDLDFVIEAARERWVDDVVAVGFPFGIGPSVSAGVVSGLNREYRAPSGERLSRLIQFDAAVNPGNSGGPLLNLNGEVVGVNTQILTGDGSRANSGVGFAVPANIIQKVVPSLIDRGSYTWAWLRVRGGTVSAVIAAANDLGELRGAYIAGVIPGGPAAQAGLRGATREVDVDGLRVPVGGDVVVAIDGQAITSFDDLLEYIALRSEVGQTDFAYMKSGRNSLL